MSSDFRSLGVEPRNVPVRRCGVRKTGGLYLVGGQDEPGLCGKLPLELKVCPLCGSGWRLSRAPYMVQEPWRIWKHLEGKCDEKPLCLGACPLVDGRDIGPALLLTIGQKYYPTPGDFLAEALEQGISRRLIQVPRGFVIGQTFVLLAHKRAIYAGYTIGEDGKQHAIYRPGLFSVFRPTRIERVYDINAIDPEQVEADRKRGITPVVDTVVLLHQEEFPNG